MEPFDRMPLRELRRVLRVAARIQTREWAAEEEARLRAEYLEAAAEVGLTEDHLRRALAEVRGSRPRRVAHPLRRVTAVTFAGLFSVTGVVWWAARQEATTLASAPAPVVSVTAVEPARDPEALDLYGYISKKSGLKYRIVRPGAGPTANEGQSVRVHYTGWLKSTGAKMDSSLDRGEPLPIVLGHDSCIAGFEEGVPGMRVGEKRRLVIPPDLGYGELGVPGAIPPHETLLFDVELVAVGDPPNP